MEAIPDRHLVPMMWHYVMIPLYAPRALSWPTLLSEMQVLHLVKGGMSTVEASHPASERTQGSCLEVYGVHGRRHGTNSVAHESAAASELASSRMTIPISEFDTLIRLGDDFEPGIKRPHAPAVKL